MTSMTQKGVVGVRHSKFTTGQGAPMTPGTRPGRLINRVFGYRSFRFRGASKETNSSGVGNRLPFLRQPSNRPPYSHRSTSRSSFSTPTRTYGGNLYVQTEELARLGVLKARNSFPESRLALN